MNPCSTHHQLFNGSRYPCFNIAWSPSKLGNGYSGKLTLWHGPNDKDEQTHDIEIVQGNPLGSISVDFDVGNGGAWDFASFEGVSITERDLQWATLWAALSLRARRSVKVGDLREIKQIINELKLPSVEESRKMAKEFKERARNDPEGVERRKEWGDQIVKQISNGIDELKQNGEWPPRTY